MAAAGAGTYWVGDVLSTTGTDRFAGWALFVAYRDNGQPIRRLNVYDGLGTVDPTHSFQTTIAPFHTPATGTVTTKAGLLTFEGDAGIASETATFNGHALTDALNPVGNVMNSTIEAGGANFTAKVPDYANQLGMDLDVYSNPGALANDQSAATLAFSSTNEYFMPSAFFLVSDEGPATSTGAGPTVGAPAGGVAHDGEALSADPGTWNGTGTLTYAYQWQRCDANGDNCQNIPGATASHYTPGAADVGGTVRVVVTATNEAGTSTPTASAPIAIKASSAPVSATPPVLSGPAAQGHPLTADPGTWSAPGPATYTYQWQRCDAKGANCVDIPGATDDTYTPTAADVGHTLRAEITATNDAGATSATTTPSAPGAGGLRPRRPRRRRRRPDRRDQLPAARRRRQVPPRRPRGHRDRPRARLHDGARAALLAAAPDDGGHRRQGQARQLPARRAPDRRGQRPAPQRDAHPRAARQGRHAHAADRRARPPRRGEDRRPHAADPALPDPLHRAALAHDGGRRAAPARRLAHRADPAVLQGARGAAAGAERQAPRRRASSASTSAGSAKPLRYKLWLPKKGAAPRLLAAAGKPAVSFRKGALRVTGLPLRTAVAEVTLYRVTKLDHPTSPRAYARRASRISREGAAAAETLAAKPKAPR